MRAIASLMCQEEKKDKIKVAEGLSNGRVPMCDYSLHSVKSRPAKVGDKLTTRDFGTGTRGFAAYSRRQKIRTLRFAFYRERNCPLLTRLSGCRLVCGPGTTV